jgi:hypothetical protein
LAKGGASTFAWIDGVVLLINGGSRRWPCKHPVKEASTAASADLTLAPAAPDRLPPPNSGACLSRLPPDPAGDTRHFVIARSTLHVPPMRTSRRWSMLPTRDYLISSGKPYLVALRGHTARGSLEATALNGPDAAAMRGVGDGTRGCGQCPNHLYGREQRPVTLTDSLRDGARRLPPDSAHRAECQNENISARASACSTARYSRNARRYPAQGSR